MVYMFIHTDQLLFIRITKYSVIFFVEIGIKTATLFDYAV